MTSSQPQPPPRYDLANQHDREDRRKHLELVSNIIGRMATASAAAKGWAVTLAGAAFGVALVRSSWYLFLLGVIALIVFAVIDGLYLHNEKRFRDLYDAVVANSVTPMSMDLAALPRRSVNRSYVSWSIVGFYLPLITAGLALMMISLTSGHETPVENEPIQGRISVTSTDTSHSQSSPQPTSTAGSLPPSTQPSVPTP